MRSDFILKRIRCFAMSVSPVSTRPFSAARFSNEVSLSLVSA
jgi:hypothetical protein